LKEVVEYVVEEYIKDTDRKLFAIGISLGAGILTNFMAKEGEGCLIDSAVVIGCHYHT
jgi:predicted alpha/beta-fold hydrolase